MKVLKLAAIIISFSGVLYSQSFIHPKLPSDRINDLCYLNNQEVIFVNDGGCIFKSYDGGITWELKKYYLGQRLLKIKFLNDKKGFVLPEREDDESLGIIYTLDGGETWDVQFISIFDVVDVLPISESLIIKSTIDGKIEKLDNFFNVWNTTYKIPNFSILTELGEYEYPYGQITKLQKLNSASIVALGINIDAYNSGIISDSLNFLLKSTDSGNTWDTLWTGLNILLDDMFFVDENIAWLNSTTSLYKSADGGKSWEEINNVLLYGSYIYSIYAVDANHIFLATEKGIIKSTDGGASWNVTEIKHQNYFDFYTKIFFHNTNDGFLFGDDLFRTDNSGNSFTRIDDSLKYNLDCIGFFSSKVGVAVTDKDIYKTTDSGKNWAKVFSIDPQFGYRANLKVINDSVAWLISSDRIFKTNDAGVTWTEINLSAKKRIYGTFDFYGSTIGFISSVSEETSTPKVYKSQYRLITTDGGEVWNQVPLEIEQKTSYFDKVQIVDPNHIVGLNYYGLWLSQDTAKTWKKMAPYDELIGDNSFYFYDSTYGVLCLSHYILITTDGGKTWKESFKPIGSSSNDCVITGKDMWGSWQAYEVGNSGNILHYEFNDKGELTFKTVLKSFTNKSLNSMDLYVENDIGNLWIGGDGFTVLYMISGKIITKLVNNIESTYKYLLSQNYPNPFNPSTLISYQLPVLSHVSLRVFDVLGREVKILVDKEQAYGKYEVHFDASGLSSGIYFYRLQTANFSSTKKMILLR